ncbi:MAG: DUF6580 family putative transport protein [Pseudomonadota bacterium]|nr:DUF6580 family putative transport protein [Pseudomonadota bacterium]MEC8996540.1 DUF6580 family putative transport protein [Pseudomonadota bacterium]MED5430094.1 DUF6580 family putative transport protein [Pseudomonadota bacterium]|tara:strand:+ start:10088 stop:10621 length:534 start_codon:yes stop_codon:yes gene_type:complete
MKEKIFLFIGFVLLLIASRMFSDIPNFTPTLSLIIFASYYFRSVVISMLIVLFSQIVSDFFIGFYDSIFFVYVSFLLITYISPIIMQKLNIYSVLVASIVSPSIFFIISNFGVWFSDSLYAQNLDGLIECYIAAIPFYDESLLSTILFSYTIYAIHKYLVMNGILIEKPIKKENLSS